jgi:hypothetical protein
VFQLTPATDEDEALVGARSALTALLHPWKAEATGVPRTQQGGSM